MPRKEVDWSLTDEQRDEAAKHIGLVVDAVKKGKRSILEFKDQVQEAAIGMMRAVQLHDATRTKFSTYATRAAVNTIKKAERRHGLIRVPDYLSYKRFESHRLGVHAGAARSVSSLECHDEIGHDPFQEADRSEGRQAVRESLDSLTPAQRRVVTSLYFDGDTVQQVAIKYNIDVGTVRRTKNKAFRRLRDVLHAYN